MSQPERIGVLGGTFDPIHNAHLAMARAALEAAHLDRVLFVVSARPPHKRDYTVATPEQRYEMIQVAVVDEPRFEACDIELHRSGPSYTGETLRELAERMPGAEFSLIMGLDSLIDFPRWKDPDVILSHANLLAARRPSDPVDAVSPSLEGKYQLLPMQETEISSTQIRGNIAEGIPIDALVPEAVERVIREKGIYAAAPKFPSERASEFIRLIRERLPDKTYRHCVSVTQTILSFREQAGITNEQAVAAGLLHDLCKGMKPAALADAAREYGITDHLDTPNLLHGPVAAEECRRTLSIDDEDVLDAIRWHTTGRADWNRVGMALFIADFSEPNRAHDGATEARRIMNEEGFEAALRFVVDQKISYVRRQFDVDPNSEAFEAWVAHEFA